MNPLLASFQFQCELPALDCTGSIWTADRTKCSFTSFHPKCYDVSEPAGWAFCSSSSASASSLIARGGKGSCADTPKGVRWPTGRETTRWCVCYNRNGLSRRGVPKSVASENIFYCQHQAPPPGAYTSEQREKRLHFHRQVRNPAVPPIQC